MSGVGRIIMIGKLRRELSQPDLSIVESDLLYITYLVRGRWCSVVSPDCRDVNV